MPPFSMDTPVRPRVRRGLALLAAAMLAAALPAGPARSEPPSAERGAVVVMYHKFGEGEYPSTNIRLEQFEAHLAELQQPRYTVLPVPEIVRALRQGRALPERTVGITIDDAYRSVYTEAWPRLRAAGLPFTVFVSTGPVDQGYGGIMSWEQLREMAASKLVSIGNHTVSHLHMPDHDAERNRRELRDAQRRIEAELGVRPTLLAYPYGEYGLAEQRLARELGFAAAFGQHSGAIGREQDMTELPRFPLNEHYGDMERFRLAVNALPLPVRGVTPQQRTLAPADNPPAPAFTVDEAAGPLEGLACYFTGRGRLTLRIEGRRVRPVIDEPLAPGRSRINCTLRGPGGRWRWYGVQFYVPGAS